MDILKLIAFVSGTIAILKFLFKDGKVLQDYLIMIILVVGVTITIPYGYFSDKSTKNESDYNKNAPVINNEVSPNTSVDDRIDKGFKELNTNSKTSLLSTNTKFEEFDNNDYLRFAISKNYYDGNNGIAKAHKSYKINITDNLIVLFIHFHFEESDIDDYTNELRMYKYNSFFDKVSDEYVVLEKTYHDACSSWKKENTWIKVSKNRDIMLFLFSGEYNDYEVYSWDENIYFKLYDVKNNRIQNFESFNRKGSIFTDYDTNMNDTEISKGKPSFKDDEIFNIIQEWTLLYDES